MKNTPIKFFNRRRILLGLTATTSALLAPKTLMANNVVDHEGGRNPLLTAFKTLYGKRLEKDTDMNAMMQKWKDVLAGKEMDSDEFSQFIPLNADKNFLNEAFLSLNNGHILVKKLDHVINDNINSGLYIIPKNEKIAKKNFYDHCDNFSKNLESFFHKSDNEISSFIGKGKWISTKDLNFYFNYIKDNPTNEAGVYSELDDMFFEKVLGKIGGASYCLYEALYSLTNNYYIVYYLLQEVVNFEVDFLPYYKIWHSGGNIYYTKNGWYVLEGNITDD